MKICGEGSATKIRYVTRRGVLEKICEGAREINEICEGTRERNGICEGAVKK